MSHCLGLVSWRSSSARGCSRGSGSTQLPSTSGAKSGQLLAMRISLRSSRLLSARHALNLKLLRQA